MKSMTYCLNDYLSNIYDEVRAEIGFDFSLSDLTTDLDIWETDVAGSLKQAYQHLNRANSGMIPDDEKTNQILLAELHIRDLLDRLTLEIADSPIQNVPKALTQQLQAFFALATQSS